MDISYRDINEFQRAFSEYYPSDECECGGIRELTIKDVDLAIGDKSISIKSCPVYKCQSCGKELIGHRMPVLIMQLYKEFEDHPGEKHCKMSVRSDLRYSYAEKADLQYDSRDLNIPGCDRDLDPTHKDGYSLPVYFDRKVLNNFYSDDDYELNFFSESYGEVGKKGTNGWPYEWIIPFGVTSKDHVAFWLGDLDQIDDNRSLCLLKAYNIESDHLLVGTEFYQAQMKCHFSEPILEKRIISLRKGFFDRVKSKYDIELYHLEDEVEDKASRIKKPISYTEEEVRSNIIALDGILNEGISQKGLKALYEKVGAKGVDEQSRTRKLLQAIIAVWSEKENAEEIIGPLFRLNDLRICFAHLLPLEEIEKKKNAIIKVYNLESFSEYKKMYDSLIKELYELYKYLFITVE